MDIVVAYIISVMISIWVSGVVIEHGLQDFNLFGE
jgi:hypothetical protein